MTSDICCQSQVIKAGIPVRKSLQSNVRARGTQINYIACIHKESCRFSNSLACCILIANIVLQPNTFPANTLAKNLKLIFITPLISNIHAFNLPQYLGTDMRTAERQT